MKKLIILTLLLPLAITGFAKGPAKSNSLSSEGKAVFEIKMKGAKASMKITKESDNKTVGEMVFEGDAGRCTFTYTAKLEPGKYKWYFTDDKHNDRSGTIEITEAGITTVQVLSIWEMDRSAKELLQPEEINNQTNSLPVWEMDRSPKEMLQPEEVTTTQGLSLWQMDRSAKELLQPEEISFTEGLSVWQMDRSAKILLQPEEENT